MNVDSTIEFVALDDSEWQSLVECPGMLFNCNYLGQETTMAFSLDISFII